MYHAPAERGVPLLCPCPVAYTIHSATTQSYQNLVDRGLLPGPVSRYLGHDPRPKALSWRSLLERAQVRRASHLLTVSEFARDELVRLLGVSPRRITVTPLAVPELFTRERAEAAMRGVCEKYGLKPPYLLYVGGFEAHKNIAGLLPILRLVRRQIPSLTLVIVGTGSVPQSFRSQIASAGFVPGRDVILLTDLGDDLASVYDSAAAFLSVSWRESFCVPFVEAMARGVPVVASEWGAGPEVLDDAGELVDPRDEHAAAAAVLKVVERPDGYIARGRARAKIFTWERTARETAAIYHQISGAAPA